METIRTSDFYEAAYYLVEGYLPESRARHLLSGGAHLRYVQELLGHRSVSSTERLYGGQGGESDGLLQALSSQGESLVCGGG